jgi:DNA-binding MarR family transcriptional regulator
LSSDSGKEREDLLRRLVRELRHGNGLGAAYFRVVAGRAGMNAADVQVIDLLAIAGPTTAGRLAERTGLTTGAIAQMLDRLEVVGLIRRERDPDDGRRVIVHLAQGEESRQKLDAIFADGERAWERLTTGYDDDQLALIASFIERSNAAIGAEIARLREAPADDAGGDFAAPLSGVATGRLVCFSGASSLTLRAGKGRAELYQARFAGTVPKVQAENGVVTIRYPKRLRLFGRQQQQAEVALNSTIPWQIVIKGGASEIDVDLVGLDLAGLDIEGGASQVSLRLPVPTGTVRVRITGGASEVTVQRPAGVAARVRVKGWASALTFDGQTYGDMVTDLRLQSGGYDATTSRYDIVVSGSGSQFTLTTD